MGAFLALATAPAVSLTGHAGVALGGALRSLLGVGAAAVPLIPLCWAVALFGHFDRSLGRRVTVLLIGLAVTVPFVVGVVYQNADAAARAALAAGLAPQPSAWVGLVGGFLAFELDGIGPVGEGLLALGAFSVLTVITVGWNPLGVLRKRQHAGGESGAGAAAAETVIAETGKPAADAHAPSCARSASR